MRRFGLTTTCLTAIIVVSAPSGAGAFTPQARASAPPPRVFVAPPPRVMAPPPVPRFTPPPPRVMAPPPRVAPPMPPPRVAMAPPRVTPPMAPPRVALAPPLPTASPLPTVRAPATGFQPPPPPGSRPGVPGEIMRQPAPRPANQPPPPPGSRPGVPGEIMRQPAPQAAAPASGGVVVGSGAPVGSAASGYYAPRAPSTPQSRAAQRAITQRMAQLQAEMARGRASGRTEMAVAQKMAELQATLARRQQTAGRTPIATATGLPGQRQTLTIDQFPINRPTVSAVIPIEQPTAIVTPLPGVAWPPRVNRETEAEINARLGNDINNAAHAGRLYEQIILAPDGY